MSIEIMFQLWWNWIVIVWKDEFFLWFLRWRCTAFWGFISATRIEFVIYVFVFASFTAWSMTTGLRIENFWCQLMFTCPTNLSKYIFIFSTSPPINLHKTKKKKVYPCESIKGNTACFRVNLKNKTEKIIENTFLAKIKSTHRTCGLKNF